MIPRVIEQQKTILEVYCQNGKKYVKGWALYSLGVSIPMEDRDNLFECEQERIDALVKAYQRKYSGALIEQKMIDNTKRQGR